MKGMVERDVLAEYPAEYHPRRLRFLGFAGGFSGAQFWRVESPGGVFCLRRWPADHPSDDQLALIHAALRWAANRGCQFIPVPRPTRQGRTFVKCKGSRWELSPWMPGKADYGDHPSRAKLEAAMQALAMFHRATADFQWPGGNPPVCAVSAKRGGLFGPSPSIPQRLQKLRDWSQGLLAKAREALSKRGWAELLPWAERALGLAAQATASIQPLLEQAACTPVRLQPCLGDVWHDHVLFTGQRVTGLVDFGAMRLDTVAGDVARLLGSLVMDDASGWQMGLSAYEAIAGPLDSTERWLTAVFDRSTVVLAPLNWIEWVCLQGRHFEDQHAIVHRMRQWVERLESSVRGGWPYPTGSFAQLSGFHPQLQFP